MWSNGATTATVSGLVAGGYTVTVTDANHCTVIKTDSVLQPTPIVLSSVITNILCAGEATGAIDLTVVGGTPGYTYHWNNNATTEDLNTLRQGIYKVTVTDAHGCTATHIDTVRQSAGIVITVIAVPATCNGSATGSASVTVTGGHQPYHILWPNGDSTNSSSGYTAGSYAVAVSDSFGCSKFANFTINQPTTLMSSVVGNNVVCYGAATGSALCSAAGGTPPYACLWSNGDTMLTNVVAGAYGVVVTDAHGCTDTSSVVISQPSPYNIIKSTTGASCSGVATGSVSLIVSGNTLPYTFYWSNGSVGQNIAGLSAGTYVVTITDANGCAIADTSSITQPDSLTARSTSTDVSCFGGNNGTLGATVTGGTQPYNFVWTHGTQTFTTQNITNATAGTYSLDMTDAGGCHYILTATVNQPAVLTSTIASTQVSCYGGANGAATVIASGGTPAYTYQWSNGATSAGMSSLQVGTYRVTITDAHACTRIDSVTIIQPNALAMSATITPVSCNGGNNGAVDLTVSGGTSSYTYSWSNGSTSADLSGVAAAIYSVTVTDAHNCRATKAVTIAQPAAIAVTDAVQDASCNGAFDGGVQLTVAGGIPTYTYNWSNGQTTKDLTNVVAGTYIVNVTDNNQCVASDTFVVNQPTPVTITSVVTNAGCNGQRNGAIATTINGATGTLTFAWNNGANTQNLTGISAGTYTLVVNSSTGCSATASFAVTEPATLLALPTVTNVLCAGNSTGAINLTVSGGTPIYHFNWSSGDTAQNITNKASTTYRVTVTDANLCRVTATATINQPSPLENTIAYTNVNCFGGADGALQNNVTGGVAPYTYLWSNGSRNNTITGLAIGLYKVTVIDANGCSRIDSSRVTQPGPLTLGATTTPVNCNGGANGAIDLTVTGPYPPFQYFWSTGELTEDINSLAAGTYSVTVTNAHNCSATVSIHVLQPQIITLSGTVTPACGGANNGSIALSVVGGTSPYTYAWSNGRTTKNLDSVPAGTYTVVVNDTNHCSASNTFTIAISPTCGLVSYRLRVKLEGPYNSSTDQMTNTLNAIGVIPSSQPYGAAPTHYNGNESVGTMPSNVTDWVLVSFRTGLTPSTTVYQMAGLMDINGFVKMTNGDSVVTFNGGGNTSLYVVVQHRNHMGIMTATAMPGAPSPINVALIDLTRLQTYQVGSPSTSGQKVVGNDAGGPIYAMHSGDGDGNFDINSNDFVPLVTDFNHFNIYLRGDFNMDGDCNSNDIPFWIRNFNLFSGVQH